MQMGATYVMFPFLKAIFLKSEKKQMTLILIVDLI